MHLLLFYPANNVAGINLWTDFLVEDGMIPLSGTSLSGNFFSALPADLRPFEPVNRLFGYFPHKIKVTLLTGLTSVQVAKTFCLVENQSQLWGEEGMEAAWTSTNFSPSPTLWIYFITRLNQFLATPRVEKIATVIAFTWTKNVWRKSIFTWYPKLRKLGLQNI